MNPANENNLKKCILAQTKFFKVLYDAGIYIANFHLKIIALFNPKLKLGVKGRSETFGILERNLSKNDKVMWFHCPSLGEYEQGLPVFESLRHIYPTHKIVLSFFSPSGYEIRKNTKIADVVVYLPLDTKSNAKQFLELVHPDLTIFVKYDIWPNFLTQMSKQNLRAFLISAVFRKDQPYFKFYGKKLRKALGAFEHIFVQNQNSKSLLNSINFNNVTLAGDTRYDRVSDQLILDNSLDFISEFLQSKICVVIGSSWPEDDEILINFINKYQNQEVKYIIAPHNIKSSQIQNLKSKINLPTILHSEKDQHDVSNFSVFIVDTIGLLSKIYSYADIAYVGGAMGHTGLHNILEPAVFGVPILIGNHYDKFPEAFQMIENGGVTSISDSNSLHQNLKQLIEDKELRIQTGQLNSRFIEKNKGAVIQIINHIRI